MPQSDVGVDLDRIIAYLWEFCTSPDTPILSLVAAEHHIMLNMTLELIRSRSRSVEGMVALLNAHLAPHITAIEARLARKQDDKNLVLAETCMEYFSTSLRDSRFARDTIRLMRSNPFECVKVLLRHLLSPLKKGYIGRSGTCLKS